MVEGMLTGCCKVVECRIVWTVKVEPCRHSRKMDECIVSWRHVLIGHKSKGGSNFTSNSINYLLAPVFEAGIFFEVLIFLLCAAFTFSFAEEP